MNHIEIKRSKDCCGCRACENICPKNAITMEVNKEGFLYPKIDKEKCVDCGMCKKVCPWLNNISRGNYLEEPICYAAKSLDKDIQLRSSSGGIFGLLSKKILQENGIVVGVEMTSDFQVQHTIIDSEKDLHKIMGSKYVASDLKQLFPVIQRELKNDRKVLFSGVPCQIAALLNYLQKGYDNLITVEVICHGVPSQKLFNKYVAFLEKKYKAKLIEYKFRSKKAASWGTYKALATFEKNKKIIYQKINADFDPYYWSFLYSENHRESCYNCKFAKKDRNADLTLGDFWGIEKIMPKMVDYNGVSVVVINTYKGKNILEGLKEKLEFHEVDYEKVQGYNKQLQKTSNRKQSRDNWYKNIDEEQFIEKIKIKKNLRSYVKIFFPQRFKFMIKKMIKRK